MTEAEAQARAEVTAATQALTEQIVKAYMRAEVANALSNKQWWSWAPQQTKHSMKNMVELVDPLAAELLEEGQAIVRS